MHISFHFLSRAGKETLIKAVAQAIRNYIMSCYKIPEGCCNNIESMLSKFWWGSSENQRKVHWLSWDRMGKSKSKGGLGFRGFSDFNKALLGKQCWRIMNDETSLLSRVLKSRYFPKTNFMAANTGHQPSYAWRSLMHAREVIALGMRWSIRNGQKVKIWSDPWIPNNSNFKVWSPIKNLEPNALVSELIDVNTKQWKRELVTNSFNNYEANKILSIPISWRLDEDKRIWNWERDGNYSVRSAYHILKEGASLNIPESSVAGDQGFWKTLWKVQVPQYVKNFLWRMARYILPTRKRLESKGINLDPTCPLCHAEKESQDYLFMHCQVVQRLWFVSPLGLHVPSIMSLSEWMNKWLTNSNLQAAQLFSLTLWRIWKGRNDAVFNNSLFCLVKIASDISVFASEFNEACNLFTGEGSSSLSTTAVVDGWVCPAVGVTKINIDAGCFEDNYTCWGLISRNSEGGVLTAMTKRETIKSTPLVAEALGLRWCLNWILEQKLQDVVVELDSETVVKCASGSLCNTDIDMIIVDCLDLLGRLTNVSIVAVKRCKNGAAHGLVGMARNVGSMLWWGNVPEPVASIICNDLLLLQ
jgi:hypothetical protein